MEIQESSLPGFYISRIFGLAPYLIKRNSKGRVDEMRRSSWLCFYSICFMIASVSLTVRFIFVDANSKTPIRMRTATSKFVTVFDVCVVVGACLCGGITGLLGQKYVQKINSNLRRADDELALFNDQVKDKKRNLYMVVVVFLTMSAMIILDVVSKYRHSKKFRLQQQMDNQPVGDVHIESYFPFYVQYFILMALHTQFAQSALGLQRRYHRLNLAIKHIFSLKKVVENAAQMKNKVELLHSGKEPAAIETNNESVLPGSNINAPAKPVVRANALSRALQDENQIAPVFGTGKSSTSLSPATYGKLAAAATTTLTQASFFLDRLTYTHAILGETVTLISKAFGITLLVMLASCLLHLVATSYFLFFELLGDSDMFVASLQLLWCCFHITRLLLIVEPCHIATVEARKTIIIVCEVLRNCRDSSVEPILQRFWRQLLADRTYYFTACGLCTIDRQILTSISGAIATYLVILIQFQKTDG